MHSTSIFAVLIEMGMQTNERMIYNPEYAAIEYILSYRYVKDSEGNVLNSNYKSRLYLKLVNKFMHH